MLAFTHVEGWSVRKAPQKAALKSANVHHLIENFHRHEPCGYCGAREGVDNGEMRGYPSCRVCMGV
jgi:hypothetical protein